MQEEKRRRLTLPVAAADVVVLAVLGRLGAAWRHFLLVSGEQSFDL